MHANLDSLSLTRDLQQKYLDILNWPEVLSAVKALCLTPYGEETWRKTPFLFSAQEVKCHLQDVSTLKQIIQAFGLPSLQRVTGSVLPILSLVSKGGTLHLEDAKRVKDSFNQASVFIHFITRGVSTLYPSGAPGTLTGTAPIGETNEKKEASNQQDGALPVSSLLDRLCLPLAVEEVRETLDHLLAEDGTLLDSASSTLAGLFQQAKSEKHRLYQDLLHQYVNQEDISEALQEAVITERDGRFVLPVKQELKFKIPGVVHGMSSSGATVFIEPAATVERNNRLLQLQGAIQREIERILISLSKFLRERHEALIDFLTRVAEADKCFSAARLSIQMDANPVTILETKIPGFVLKNAKHPLLCLQHSRNLEIIVGNSFEMGGNTPVDPTQDSSVKTLIITGPNTGGKTVLLKMVGLYALMAWAGLHLPAQPGSAISLFRRILADIGDQQSIAQNLSTFSAHLLTLQSFLASKNNAEEEILTDIREDLAGSLILVDEICAGTDPVEGAALAKALLQTFHQKGAITLTTTHLGELKLFAHKLPGFSNASMTFELESLKPTYRLLMGIPGASHALTIADRLGLEPSILRQANAFLVQPSNDSAALLVDLEQKSHALQESLQEARQHQQQANETSAKLEEELSGFRKQKRQLLSDYRTQLKSRLHLLEDDLKQARREFESAHLEATRVRSLARQADETFEGLDQSLTQEEYPQGQQMQTQVKRMAALKVGQRVRCERHHLMAEILSLHPDSFEVTVQAGRMRLTLPVLEILPERTTGPSKKKPPFSITTRKIKNQVSDAAMPEGSFISLKDCDVRGQRVEEALESVERFLDEMVHANIECVGIIHGLGTGALKQAIRNTLKTSQYVQRFFPAGAMDGGDGKTVVLLN